MRRLFVALLLSIAPTLMRAQIRPGIRPPAIRPGQTQRRAPGDTTRLPGDTTKKDSTLFKWSAPDSVMQSLMNKPGYTVTRYEGQVVTFDALQRAIEIITNQAKSAAVKRSNQLIISDSTIAYSEKTKLVDVTPKKGGTLVLSDSGSGQADIVGHGRLTYNLARRTARINSPSFPIDNGERWFVTANVLQYVGDTANSKAAAFYGKGGTLTSCDDSIPDYHFEYKEIKRSSTNTLVARPAVLYIRDVPVMWLPFIFQDTRGGRHSGILTPQFGLSDIVRNSPAYRRMVQNFGYYFAMNDYMDASVALDWRSSAGGSPTDPGWMKYKGQWNYRWLDRFLSGWIATDYTTQSDGLTNWAINWSHNQQFNQNRRINVDMNYVTSTTLQRQNALNPFAALATIRSNAAFSDKYGPLSLSLGGTRTQYPGRPQVDQTLPTLSLTSVPINVASWLVWTPNLQYSSQQSLNIDQPGPFSQRYFTNAAGQLDSSKINKNSSSSTTSFDTPLRIFGYDLRNSFTIRDQRIDFPQQFTIYDVQTGNIIGQRVFATDYETAVDWTPTFALPPILHNIANVTPAVSLSNVDPGPFWVRTERSNGQFVHQAKRVTLGLSSSPSVYGFFPGFGPFSLIRHSLNPTFSWNYAPSSSVDTTYLKALGRTKHGYLGNLAQNMLTFGLTQNFEAKVRNLKQAPTDSTTPQNAEKIKLLSITTGSFGYDFERASHSHRAAAGFYIPTNESFSYSLRSDLLPGFDFSSDYSLFEGSTLSDTARFKPYRTNIRASFNIGQNNNPFAVLTRLFGRAVPEKEAPTPTARGTALNSQDVTAQQMANQPVAGMSAQRGQFLIPPAKGWNLSLTFTASTPRPVSGTNVIQFDPKYRCAQYQAFNPIVYQSCLNTVATTPSTEAPIGSTIAGAPAFNIPAQESVQSAMNFELTEKWSASWTTSYDFERHAFASHMVSLQRDLHDWRAIFAFTQSPNGNFAFSFNIALKAEPDLKFNYNKSTYRGSTYFPY